MTDQAQTDTQATIPPHPAVFSAPIVEAIRALIDEYMESHPALCASTCLEYGSTRGEGRARSRCDVWNEHDCEGMVEAWDPFAGVGTIFEIEHPRLCWHGVELEREWAQADERIKVGDSCRLSQIVASTHEHALATNRDHADLVVTSPAYGNRMADSHEAKDACSKCGGDGAYWEQGQMTVPTPCKKCKGTGLSPRRSYRHWLGRMPSQGSSTTLHFDKGGAYEDLHVEVWHEVARTMNRGGWFILNVKDFLRTVKVNGVKRQTRMEVVKWHLLTVLSITEPDSTSDERAFKFVREVKVPVKGARYGENGEARIDHESVLVFERV